MPHTGALGWGLAQRTRQEKTKVKVSFSLEMGLDSGAGERGLTLGGSGRARAVPGLVTSSKARVSPCGSHLQLWNGAESMARDWEQ